MNKSIIGLEEARPVKKKIFGNYSLDNENSTNFNTWIALTDFIDKQFIEAGDNSTTNRNHKILVCALNKRIHTAFPS
jgi:hypothetical protein